MRAAEAIRAEIGTVGVVGAGRFGSALASRTVAAGFRTLIAASGDPSRLRLVVGHDARGAEPRWAREVVTAADTVVLALPLPAALELLPALGFAPDALAGRLVIDATNYWWASDGDRPELTDAAHPTSVLVREAYVGARVVKAFNHLGHQALADLGRSAGHPDRRGVAVTGDDAADVRLVAEFVDALGFDPVVAGPLSGTVSLQPDSPAFGSHADAATLRRLLGIGDGTVDSSAS